MEQFTSEVRLGDVIDDHCIKCRRITNHSIVSIVDGKAAKVRCRTCYHDHDYRNEQAPPSKKDLKKQELFKEVLANVAPAEIIEEAHAEEEVAVSEEPPAAKRAPAVKHARAAAAAHASTVKKAKARKKA